MDGIETARQIRTRLGSKVPILLLSAYDWENVRDEAVEAGINGFLTKPIFKSELLEQLKYYTLGEKNETGRGNDFRVWKSKGCQNPGGGG